MLLDLLEPNENQRDSLRTVLSRRTAYLAHRASLLAGQESPAGQSSWRHAMAIATLWLEAAESAAALNRIRESSEYLSNAAEVFLSLQMPFGAVLQKTLLPHDEKLAVLADEVLDIWREYFLREREASHTFANHGLSPFMYYGVKSVEQQAYFALGEALSLSHSEKSQINFDRASGNIHGLSQTAIGRLRLPLECYQSTADFIKTTVEMRGDVTDSILEQPIRAIVEALYGLHRSVESARSNTYLWSRLLAPAPLFDFDIAILIGSILITSGVYRLSERLDSAVNEMLTENSKAYTKEFFAVVNSLRKNSNFEPPDEPTPAYMNI
ncbi:hypothetical protein ANRL3_00137 [Anaerolineae bacterium]|nr:hypothetical protein ANRL3_00137 [Anaerolineae bacterium]